ncbi:signal transduction histidine kinase [Paenibacillus castaneae]|uniref:sensor histidine kinase n=1 Tax=Paenibacillus castaneae TaxID=474957 RepID=UPI000C9BC9A0|nr:HAMP domain-containing sensor histidine kinase [Paenibacillus castaneae]NIK77810.1 signal transduction histidine kinase [Paenibacillus castaneae]
MTILLIILIIAAVTLFIMKARNPSAYWMGFVLVGWFLSMFGLILFIAKYGGFYYRVNIVLFFNDAIRNMLLNLPIKIEGISRIITIGRSLFIFSLVGLSVSLMSYRPFWRNWKIHMLSFIPALANLIFYDPVIYKRALTIMDRDHTFIIGWITRGWLVLSALIAVSLMIWKYRTVTIPWAKRQSGFIILGVLSLALFYFYLGFMGPLQVFDIRTFYVLYSDFSNFNPPLTLSGWYLSIGLTGVLSIVSIYAVWRYTEIELKMGKDDLLLKRKLDTANMGAQVFTHAVKNQLIMLQLLVRQATEALEASGSTETQSIGAPLAKADEIVHSTLGRLDQLYKSFKTNQIQLKPQLIHNIIDHSLDRIKPLQKHVEIKTALPDPSTMILADFIPMSEAIYNLLINAIEAIDSEYGGLIHVLVYTEDHWVIIKIMDNGPGIPAHMLDEVFDPFVTNKNTTKNWGVGLSYVKHIILAHYGRIHVESKPEVGSSFQLIIPLYELNTDIKKR